ncbi:MAG: nucleoside triphosphate pyrophosphohydrolase [Candidatus Binatia bacterium]
MTVAQAFEELVGIMHRLRAPGGCPWDREQSHASIKPYLIEEAYEVAEAIDAADDRELCTELGDLLLQIVFHAEMAAESDRFTIADVIRAISEKMVRRHPHVFGDVAVSGADEVLRNWSRIKAEERQDSADTSALAGVPRAMPGLLRAQRLGEKAAHAGFDWSDSAGVVAKLREELGEIEAALAGGDPTAAAAELGDLLFAGTSLARHLLVSAEDVVKGAADRFSERFRSMEGALTADNMAMERATPAELDALWEAAKRAQKAG